MRELLTSESMIEEVLGITLREELRQRIEAGIKAIETEEKVERRFDELEKALAENKDQVWTRIMCVMDSEKKRKIKYVQYLIIESLDKESLTAHIKVIGDTLYKLEGIHGNQSSTLGIGVMNIQPFDPIGIDWDDFLDDNNPTIYGTARAYFFQYLPD